MGFSKSLIAGQVRKPQPRRVNIIEYLGTSSPPQAARIPTASRFVFPRWLRWVPPTTALLQRRTTKRLYFGLSAHRSFTREHFGVATFKKTRGPYIPGFKSRGFTALKGNAFPPYASKVVSDVPSLYAHNQARQTSEILAGRGVDHGAFAPGPQYPLGCSV